MTTLLPDTQDEQPPTNLYLRTTGGQKYEKPLPRMSETAILAPESSLHTMPHMDS